MWRNCTYVPNAPFLGTWAASVLALRWPLPSRQIKHEPVNNATVQHPCKVSVVFRKVDHVAPLPWNPFGTKPTSWGENYLEIAWGHVFDSTRVNPSLSSTKTPQQLTRSVAVTLDYVLLHVRCSLTATPIKRSANVCSQPPRFTNPPPPTLPLSSTFFWGR